MVRATSTQIYNPPALPDYLKNVYNLKPIVGAPNDEEVKGIHAVIRAAQTVAQVPGVISLELSMSLAQHLFEVQMARYRDRYPCGAFPEDMIQTPPTLPSHVSITLEPVAGAPSDEEIEAVYTSVRAYEQLAIVPSMFDPKVGMELSQHLFNIQFARYMNQAPQRELSSKSEYDLKDRNQASRSSTSARQPVDSTRELIEENASEIPNESSAGDPVAPVPTSARAKQTAGNTSLCAAVEETNRRLTIITDTLEGVKKVLIMSQQSFAQGMRNDKMGATAARMAGFEMMNCAGELPTHHGLPKIGRDSYTENYNNVLSDEQLIRYLQFYSLGQDLLEVGGTPAIKAGKRRDAEVLLSDFVNDHICPS